MEPSPARRAPATPLERMRPSRRAGAPGRRTSRASSLQSPQRQIDERLGDDLDGPAPLLEPGDLPVEHVIGCHADERPGYQIGPHRAKGFHAYPLPDVAFEKTVDLRHPCLVEHLS